MKKYIILSILILVVIIGAGCSSNDQTITIQSRTPYVVRNELNLDWADESGLLMPIKSIKVLNSSTPVDVTLKKTDNNTKDTNLYKYKDLNKYSTISFSFNSDHLEKKYGNIYTMDYVATFEITLYKNEICKESLSKLKSYTYLMPSANDTIYMLSDEYNGGIKGSSTSNTFLQTDIEKVYEARTKGLNYSYEAMLHEFISKPEFIKVANEIKSTFKSDSAYDKSNAIYSWIIKNIKYDQNANRVYSFNDKDTPSAYRALLTEKTTCVGYSHLFDAIARYWDVPEFPIAGHNGKDGHMWNVVRDGNKALLIDCTPDKTYFVYAPDEAFANTHLVWDDKLNRFTPFLNATFN